MQCYPCIQASQYFRIEQGYIPGLIQDEQFYPWPERNSLHIFGPQESEQWPLGAHQTARVSVKYLTVHQSLIQQSLISWRPSIFGATGHTYIIVEFRRGDIALSSSTKLMSSLNLLQGSFRMI